MKEIYNSSKKIYADWISNVQRILSEQGKTYKQDDGGDIDKLMKAISVIWGMPSIPPSENIPISQHFQINDNWVKLIQDEFFKFNNYGDEYICSTTEAMIKINGIKRPIDQFDKPMYFRGEHDFGWELKSRLGRKIKIEWDKTDSNKVTKEELELVKSFQKKVSENDALKEKIFGTLSILDKNDSGWWSLMQHYDEEYGTRMIDVTSSIFCALYFACANWNGTVDKSVDGKLYFFPNKMGRGETDIPDLSRGEIIGTEDLTKKELEDYFTIGSSLDFPRFRISPTRNDRALSQDGYFIWQPKFDQPLDLAQHFAFRIHRDFKESILTELESMGYTRERILDENRFGNHT